LKAPRTLERHVPVVLGVVCEFIRMGCFWSEV
jgi:hypothetical protein